MNHNSIELFDPVVLCEAVQCWRLKAYTEFFGGGVTEAPVLLVLYCPFCCGCIFSSPLFCWSAVGNIFFLWRLWWCCYEFSYLTCWFVHGGGSIAVQSDWSRATQCNSESIGLVVNMHSDWHTLLVPYGVARVSECIILLANSNLISEADCVSQLSRLRVARRCVEIPSVL